MEEWRDRVKKRLAVFACVLGLLFLALPGKAAAPSAASSAFGLAASGLPAGVSIAATPSTSAEAPTNGNTVRNSDTQLTLSQSGVTASTLKVAADASVEGSGAEPASIDRKSVV